MDNIVNYAEQTLETFDKLDFKTADSLILSWVSYFHWPKELKSVYSWKGIKLKDLFRAEYFKELFWDVYDQEDTKRLFVALVSSPRYRNAIVKGFVERWDKNKDKEKQFSAISFQLNDNESYVAFRGTDSSLAGWKENFNMAFQYPVPSQEDAKKYLDKAAKHLTGNIRVGGHSKGGNLAIYAAANANEEYKSRIAKVYSHDGPGFLEMALKSENFISISDRIEKTLPQSSLVGMLLENCGEMKVLKSDRFGIWQHDPFSWMIKDKDFIYIKAITPSARYLDRTLNMWVRSMSEQDRERFVNSLYSLIDVDNVNILPQSQEEWQNSLPAVVNSATKLDKDTKNFLTKAVKSLLRLGVQNLKV